MIYFVRNVYTVCLKGQVHWWFAWILLLTPVSCSLSGASTASLYVWNPLGHWQGTTMSEHFYMLRECYTRHFPFVRLHSCYSQSVFPQWTYLKYLAYCVLSLHFLSVFLRLSVPAGFLLATVLGCVCLGIASIIYLAVSGQLSQNESPVCILTLIKVMGETWSGQFSETRKWKQGRDCFMTSTSVETWPFCYEIRPVRGVPEFLNKPMWQ